MKTHRTFACCIAVAAALACLAAAPLQATNYWKNSVVTGNWSNVNNWSGNGAIFSDNAGAPILNEAVNIALTDGRAHTVTYDVAAPAIGILAIDLIGGAAGATTTATLSLPGNINLTTNGIAVGGYNGVTGPTGLTSGRGAITQSGGTVTTNPVVADLILGWGAGSTGVYTLSGGALVNNLNEYVGLSGTGTFNHSGGSNTINASETGFFSVGHNAGSTGTYNLSGTGALSTSATQYIGYGGTGNFNHSGGTNTISGAGKNLYLGFNVGSTYTLSAGSLNVSNGDEVILSNSTFNQTGGTNTVKSLNIFDGYESTYNLSGGTLICNSSATVGGYNAFNHTGGANSIAGHLSIGYYGFFNLAGYNLGGTGSLSTVDETIGIGFQHYGILNQTGGTHTVTGNLRIGDGLESVGFYNLSAGQASIGSMLSVGSSAGGVGALTVSGTGALTVGGVLKVHNTSYFEEGFYTSLNLSGGTINTAALDLGGTPSLLNWTGGKLNLTQSVTWDPAAAATSTSAVFGSSLVLGGNRTLMVTGNEALGGAGAFGLTLNSGSLHTVTGGITINPNAALTLNGGTLNTGSLVINGALSFNSGTLGISGPTGLVVGAGGPLGTTLLIDTDQNLNVTNTLTVNSGAYLAVAGGFSSGNLVNNGNLVMINTAIGGPVVNNNAVTVVGSVDFNGQVSGPGDFFGPGTANFNGGLAPGGSPAEVSFEGSLTLTDTNTLFIEIGGTMPGSQYDRLAIVGSASLDGELQVTLINGFTPVAGHAFPILDWATRSGTFDTIVLPALAEGLLWSLDYGSTALTLLVYSTVLPGDIDFDGDVDRTDAARFSQFFGTTSGAVWSEGDFDGNRRVDMLDLAILQSHFGQGMIAPSGVVPEPSTLVLALMGLIANSAFVRIRALYSTRRGVE